MSDTLVGRLQGPTPGATVRRSLLVAAVVLLVAVTGVLLFGVGLRADLQAMGIGAALAVALVSLALTLQAHSELQALEERLHVHTQRLDGQQAVTEQSDTRQSTDTARTQTDGSRTGLDKSLSEMNGSERAQETWPQNTDENETLR
jgi:choline-glycine betaine transporter